MLTLGANLLGVINDLHRAACRGEDPELFFDSRRVKQAKRLCVVCPLAEACLEHALGHELAEHLTQVAGGRGGAVRNHGVFGGWTAEERKPVLYRRAARAAGQVA